MVNPPPICWDGATLQEAENTKENDLFCQNSRTPTNGMSAGMNSVRFGIEKKPNGEVKLL